MSAMYRWILGGVAIALVGAAALWWIGGLREAPSQAADSVVENAPRRTSSPNTQDPALGTAEPARQGSQGGQFSVDQYEISMDDPILEPRSEAELEWLRRNGYPSAEAKAAATQFLATEMDFNHADGIDPIEMVAAEQFALQHPDNRARAVRFLNEAAISGSTYALETLARLHQSPSDPVTSEAYFRAAAQRGDWNANLRVRPTLTSEQEMLASLLAHQVIDNLEIQRRQRGLPQLGVDLRPGLDSFLQQIKEAERAAAASRS